MTRPDCIGRLRSQRLVVASIDLRRPDMTIHSHTVRRGAAIAVAAGVGVALTLTAGASGATVSRHTEVIHLFSKSQSFTYTKADGKIVKHPPQKPHAGDH